MYCMTLQNAPHYSNFPPGEEKKEVQVWESQYGSQCFPFYLTVSQHSVWDTVAPWYGTPQSQMEREPRPVCHVTYRPGQGWDCEVLGVQGLSQLTDSTLTVLSPSGHKWLLIITETPYLYRGWTGPIFFSDMNNTSGVSSVYCNSNGCCCCKGCGGCAWLIYFNLFCTYFAQVVSAIESLCTVN